MTPMFGPRAVEALNLESRMRRGFHQSLPMSSACSTRPTTDPQLACQADPAKGNQATT